MTGTKGFHIRDLRFAYGSQMSLQHISLDLEPGRFYGLIGPNGSGKTTLLSLLAGHLTPSGGSIALDGQALNRYSTVQRARLLTVVPQSFSLNFDFSVHDVVLMGRHPYLSRFARPSEEDFALVEQSMAAMEIERFRHRSVRRLSGGEKQRVMIARALTQDTAYLLLDEVTANLDLNHSLAIMRLVARLTRDGRTVIAALHDLNLAMAFCDRVIVLQDGRLHGFGPAATTISPTLVKQLYGIDAELCRPGNRNAHISFHYQEQPQP